MSFLQSVLLGLLVLIVPPLMLALVWSDGSRAALLGFLELSLRRFQAPFYPRPALAWIDWARKAYRGALARAFLAEAARTGDPQGVLEEGLFYWEGGMGTAAKASAAPRFLRAAEAGLAEAMYWVAEDLRWGVSQPADQAGALAWYRRGALAGSGACMSALAQLLKHCGSEEALAEAARWEARLVASTADPNPRRSAFSAGAEGASDPLVRATENTTGMVEAWFEHPRMRPLLPILGWTAILLFTTMAGILLLLPFLYGGLFAIPMVVVLAMLTPMAWRMHRDHRPGIAIRHHFDRAQSGDPGGAFAMGMACLQGRDGLPKDQGEARRWLRIAAEGGHLEAMVELSSLLRWDLGGFKDLVGADDWLRRAAEAGHAEAKRRLQEIAEISPSE